MKIKELIEATNAKVIKPLEENLDVKISTDTRTIKDGDFYLPLKVRLLMAKNLLTKHWKRVQLERFVQKMAVICRLQIL